MFAVRSVQLANGLFSVSDCSCLSWMTVWGAAAAVAAAAFVPTLNPGNSFLYILYFILWLSVFCFPLFSTSCKSIQLELESKANTDAQAHTHIVPFIFVTVLQNRVRTHSLSHTHIHTHLTWPKVETEFCHCGGCRRKKRNLNLIKSLLFSFSVLTTVFCFLCLFVCVLQL